MKRLKNGTIKFDAHDISALSMLDRPQDLDEGQVKFLEVVVLSEHR